MFHNLCSPEVTFSFLIKISTPWPIETKIAFLIPAQLIISFVLKIFIITSLKSCAPPLVFPLLLLKGNFTQKASCSEMKELTKRRRTPLTVCKHLFYFSRYFILKFQISLHGRRHRSLFKLKRCPNDVTTAVLKPNRRYFPL